MSELALWTSCKYGTCIQGFYFRALAPWASMYVHVYWTVWSEVALHVGFFMQSYNIRASSAGPNVKTCIQGCYVRAKLCGLQYIRASSLGFNVGTCIQGCNVRASSVGFKVSTCIQSCNIRACSISFNVITCTWILDCYLGFNVDMYLQAVR